MKIYGISIRKSDLDSIPTIKDKKGEEWYNLVGLDFEKIDDFGNCGSVQQAFTKAQRERMKAEGRSPKLIGYFRLNIKGGKK